MVTDSRQRMLDSAAELFARKGYHSTGLNELVAAGGAPKGSLYFHFPGGKEQLAAEALHASGRRMAELIDGVLAEAAGPADAVVALVAVFARLLRESDFRQGCPLATVALDAGTDSTAIRESCADGYGDWLALIERCLYANGVGEQRAATLATVVLTSVEGALLLAKTTKDTAPLDAVGEHLRTVLEGES